MLLNEAAFRDIFKAPEYFGKPVPVEVKPVKAYKPEPKNEKLVFNTIKAVKGINIHRITKKTGLSMTGAKKVVEYLISVDKVVKIATNESDRTKHFAYFIKGDEHGFPTVKRVKTKVKQKIAEAGNIKRQDIKKELGLNDYSLDKALTELMESNEIVRKTVVNGNSRAFQYRINGC
jgi:predicted transcriptional regulator